MARSLGEFEQTVLLAVLRLGEEAYGASIHREMEAVTSRKFAYNAVYATLDRLERKGYVESEVGAPTPLRGGRRKKHFRLLPLGLRLLRESHRDYLALISGIEGELLSK